MTQAPSASRQQLRVAALAALGVVFGDIGTSPLYAMQIIFTPGKSHSVPVNPEDVLGVVSLIFWAVTLVVTIKYVALITRADNDGEGGIMALIALIRDRVSARSAGLVVLGLCGAALFYGDSILTPAISVLSAVEGLEVISPGLASLVLPVTVTILVGLFAMQRLGTGQVGRLFGPVMLVWFLVLGALGLHMVLQHPGILRGLSPHYALLFIADHPLLAFFSLSAVVLTITGGEALYADMGHFGRPAIIRAWLTVAFPCLILNYLGQAALILRRPETVENPFFLLAPDGLRTPLVVLATVATVIASQAVISGAFSVTRQAVQLGYLPRVHIRHTSEDRGQIYVPLVNWTLLAAVLVLVLAFGSSASLAGAYGIAVTATTFIDTLLFFFVVRVLWRRSWQLAVLGALAFGAVDLAFLAACSTKLLDGGWVPVGTGMLVLFVLLTWKRGRELLTQRRQEQEGSLAEFVDAINAMQPPLARTPGTAVFLHPGDQTAPLAMRANVEHNHLLHEQTVILWIQTDQVPHVHPKHQLTVSDLGYADDGIFHITARFGFQDQPNIPRLLRQAQDRGLLEAQIDVAGASYFLSKMEIRRTARPGMSRLRKRLFQLLSRAAFDPVAFFGLPYERAVIMGSHVEL